MGYEGFSAPVVDPKKVDAGLPAVRDSCVAISVMIAEMSENAGPSCWDELLAKKMELLYAQLAIALGKKA
ncbi:MAG TPA: hypothetical protein VLB83_04975 [Candidatus Paceibacterota bacterium]|nr:hypothetical protein [Candidatus Paceibacterota bacterium]